MNQKELAMKQALESALRHYGGEFYLNGIKIEVTSIEHVQVTFASCVCPDGLDSSSWDLCKKGYFDADMKIMYKTGEDTKQSSNCQATNVNFDVLSYNGGTFVIEITTNPIRLTNK